MASEDPIASWLSELRQRLRYDPLLAARVLNEVADHLIDAASDEQRAGRSVAEARRRAVERFGQPAEFVSSLPRYEVTLRLASLGAAVGSIAIGVFVVIAIVWLIPPAESSTLPLWTGAALAALLYGAFTWLFFVTRVRAFMPSLMALSSIAALGGALMAIASSILVALRTGDWEFYVLTGGLVVTAHSVTVMSYLYCLKKLWSNRQVPAFPG